jgi:hypothetical protein
VNSSHGLLQVATPVFAITTKEQNKNSQENWPPGLDFNPRSSKYEVELLSSLPQYSVKYVCVVYL